MFYFSFTKIIMLRLFCAWLTGNRTRNGFVLNKRVIFLVFCKDHIVEYATALTLTHATPPEGEQT